MSARSTIFLTTVLGTLALTSTAAAQPQNQVCWCFSWVHGEDHGNSCFMTEAACDGGRRQRGPSGDSTACATTEQPACERTGYRNGQPMNLGPTRPRASSILGKTLAQLRPTIGAPTGRDSGWIRFGPHVAVQLSRTRVVRVLVKAHVGLTCAEVVAREGFADATAALRRSDSCEWPGISLRHRLDPEGRYAGRVDLSRGTFELWRR